MSIKYLAQSLVHKHSECSIIIFIIAAVIIYNRNGWLSPK